VAAATGPDPNGGAETFYLDCRRDALPGLLRRLAFYRLRSKVTLTDLSDAAAREPALGVVAILPPAAPPTSVPCYRDPRHNGLGHRAILPAEEARRLATVAPAHYEARRLALGIPEGGSDFALGDLFPQEALMDLLGGVDFGKGCYVGQEVVSRMQHRGTARSRLVPVSLSGHAAAGADVRAGGTPIGRLSPSVGPQAFALLRLDRVSEALAAGQALTVGETQVTLVRPAWWTAGWPNVDGSGEAQDRAR
jgi:folate-binding protein YgfZ